MVTETYPPEVNGVARTIGLMAEGLEKRGHSIQLVRPRQNGHDHAMDTPTFVEVLRPGIPIPRYTQLKMGMPSGRMLERAWREQRPDIVHIATEGPLGWSALSAARRLEIPVATDFHTNFHTYMRDYGMAWLARPVAAFLRSCGSASGAAASSHCARNTWVCSPHAQASAAKSAAASPQ